MDNKRRYLVHIRLGQGKPAISRIRSAASEIQGLIKDMSDGEYQLAYTSHDGATFGFFLKTHLVSAQIRGKIASPGKERDIMDRNSPAPLGSPFLNDDAMLVLELGPDFSGIGLSRGWTWLQHH